MAVSGQPRELRGHFRDRRFLASPRRAPRIVGQTARRLLLLPASQQATHIDAQRYVDCSRHRRHVSKANAGLHRGL